VPWRSRAAEQELVGRELTAAVADRAAAAAVADTDPLAHNGAKVEIVRTIVAEELLALV
jgi:xanthine dehydrogenase YagS FAD-binding subunit